MSQDEKEKKDNKSKKKIEKSLPEEKVEIVRMADLSAVALAKSIEAAMQQGRIFEEMSKAIGNVGMSSIMSSLRDFKTMEESTKMIMMAMADNMRVPIINPEILGNIDEIAKTYSELNRAVRDISDLTYIGDKEALKNIINIKMEGTMRAQNAYIEALERELREKEEVIRQLLEIIDEKKKKDDFVV